MRLLIFCGIVLAALQGCSWGFTEADDGDSEKFMLGKTFRISLPTLAEGRTPMIKNGEIVRFLGFEKDEKGGRDVFEFKAIGAGETEIQIAKEGKSPNPSFYTFTARVVLGGSPY